jgi:hypothetical protein
MKNFYDLLGARPDDDAETLRKAYRKAAKASHPDRHGGDQDAAAQFRQIVETYNILRDAEQRAAYNRFLEFQRKPLRAKLKRAISELKHHIVYDAVAAVVFTIVAAGGYTLFVRISETPVHEAAGSAGNEPEGMVAVQAAHRNRAERDNLGRVAAPLIPIFPRAAASAASDPDASEKTKDEPVPRQAGQTIDVARHDDHSGVAIDRPRATGDPGKSQRVHPFDPHEALSTDVEFSLAGRHDFGPNASSSGSDKLGSKSSEPGGGNTGDRASAANDPDALEMTKDEAVARQAGQTIDVARHDDHSGVVIDQPRATTGEADPGKSQRVHPFDRHEAPSADAVFSVPGRHDFGPNPSSSGNDKLGNKSSEPGVGNTGDLVSAANDPDALRMRKDALVPRQARQTIDVARHDDHSGVAIDQPRATAGEGDPGKSQRVHPFDRHEALSADAAFSVPGRHDVAPNAFSSRGDKLGNKSSEPGGRNTGDLKVPKKISARPLPAVKRQAASRPPFKQALLQDRNTSGGVPPLFGVGP